MLLITYVKVFTCLLCVINLYFGRCVIDESDDELSDDGLHRTGPSTSACGSKGSY